MQDHRDDADSTFASDAAYAEEQRQALRDLLRLADECAQGHRQIERESDSVRQTAQSAATRLERRLQRRYQRLKDALKDHWRGKIDRVKNHAVKELSALEAQRRSGINKVMDEVESTEHRAEQKLEQGLWLAESMYEAGLEQAQVEYRQTKDRIQADSRELEQIAEAAREQLQLFALQAPDLDTATTEAPDEPDESQDDEADDAVGSGLEAYEIHRDAAQDAVERMRRLLLPRLFRGVVPFVIVVVVCVGAVVATWWVTDGFNWAATTHVLVNGGSLVAAAAGVLGIGAVLRRISVRRLWSTYQPAHENLNDAHRDLERRLTEAQQKRAARREQAQSQRQQERHQAEHKYRPVLDEVIRRREAATAEVEKGYNEKSRTLEAWRDKKLVELREQANGLLAQLNARYQQLQATAHEKYKGEMETRDHRWKREQAALEKRWKQGLARIEAVVEQSRTLEAERFHAWDAAVWKDWQPPHEHTALIRFGGMTVDMRQAAADAAKQGSHKLKAPKSFEVPAVLALPQRGSLLIETDADARDAALDLLHTVMARLLTTLPPGQVRFTLLDPVGLGQSFAGFMHLTDYDDKLVGSRIWTEQEHIERRLGDLTSHMENVIQKYLRNEFATIDEYNTQADELAEPYRFVVIADYPGNFSEEAVRRLSSIVTSGARCGVYALVLRDVRHPMSEDGAAVDDLRRNCVHLAQAENSQDFVWQDDVFGHFPLRLDRAPGEQRLTDLLNLVGDKARISSRVEVPFASIAPKPAELWSLDSASELHVPMGRSGATRLQQLRFGQGVAQHALMAGKTGSGKSTLLHVLVTNLALWYSPDQVEFYLVDFKKGVEFKTYATHRLPHARAVAIESDREFGLSVLQRLDGELTRRGELFRDAAVQNLADFREAKPKVVMPRTLLIVDEFQELFSEDDKIAQDAALLIDRLVRQGRAFGIHVLLGSQTLAGSSGLSRSTVGQMAVRIALQCSEADAQLIFDDHNTAAQLLSRPGEAIHNDAGGAIEGNNPFQVSWLDDAERDTHLEKIVALTRERGIKRPAPIVFEGSSDADITGNAPLTELLEAPTWPTTLANGEAHAWLGDPVTIKPPTSVVFTARSGSNMLIVGQRDESALALLSASLLSLAAQHAPDAARFVVLDGTPTDAQWAGQFDRLAAALPHEVRVVPFRESEQAMAELVELVQQRQADGGDEARQAVYVIVNGLQRYRMLRKSEDDFSFSMSDEGDAGDKPDKQFAEVLREGPALNVHTLAWCDTATALERTLERTALREFDCRVLFQMSANDSSNLIDNPVANRLGSNRALAYSEEQGVMEKFRPYALPDDAWLKQVADRFQHKAAPAS
ncbi:MAG: FtsK/SpoIIIE domain-containing protein [Phycisphaeraceae bacterium]